MPQRVKTPFTSKIIRSNRKSVSISITPKAEVIVRVPTLLRNDIIQDIIDKKLPWINEKLDIVRNSAKKTIDQGETLSFLGSEYLIVKNTELKKISINGDRIEIPGAFFPSADNHLKDAGLIEKKITEWYKKESQIVLRTRCSMISARHGINYSGVKISSARTRWGSCGARGSINLSWRLVMCPVAVIDYVIVHELVHIEIRNHSKRFWNKVEELMPDYREHEKWLKENSRRLGF